MSPVVPEWELRPALAPVLPAGKPRTRFNARERQWLFFVLDVALTILVVCLTVMITGHGPGALPLVATLGLLGLMAAQVYEPRRRWSAWQLMFRIAVGTALAGGSVALLGLWLPEVIFHVSTVTTLLATQITLLAGWRLACFQAFATSPARSVLVVGADQAGQALVRDIERHPDSGYQVVGFIDDGTGPVDQVTELPVMGAMNQLPGISRVLQVDAIAIRTTDLPNKDVLVACIEQGTSILTYPDVYEDLMARVPVAVIDATWFIHELRDADKRLYVVSKRLTDMVVATLGLTLTALLVPWILLAIRLGGGPGPFLYSQTRVGYQGRSFQILKFRTMCQDAERSGAVWAAQNDQRVTPVGRFLRQTRLDELPQFWNVLRGEMSIVGPRPERPEFVSVLDREIPFYRQRHMVPPGLTGWAQVRFPYGASVSDAFEKLQYDLFYIKHRSSYLDFKIMAKTFGVMVQKIGAR